MSGRGILPRLVLCGVGFCGLLGACRSDADVVADKLAEGTKVYKDLIEIGQRLQTPDGMRQHSAEFIEGARRAAKVAEDLADLVDQGLDETYGQSLDRFERMMGRFENVMARVPPEAWDAMPPGDQEKLDGIAARIESAGERIERGGRD